MCISRGWSYAPLSKKTLMSRTFPQIDAWMNKLKSQNSLSWRSCGRGFHHTVWKLLNGNDATIKCNTLQLITQSCALSFVHLRVDQITWYHILWTTHLTSPPPTPKLISSRDSFAWFLRQFVKPNSTDCLNPVSKIKWKPKPKLVPQHADTQQTGASWLT
jgi:hypothetical protein